MKQNFRKPLDNASLRRYNCVIKTHMGGGAKVDWLKDIRTNIGKTQEQVADDAGITRGAYCNIETGDRRPSVEVAKRIAEVLGFEWTRFFEEGR